MANATVKSRPKHPTEVIPVAVPGLGNDVKCWIGGQDVPPLFIEAKAGRFESRDDVLSWVNEHRPELDRLTVEHGGIWLRGFPLKSAEDFNAVMGLYPAFEGGYVAGGSPRKKVTGQVMESTQLDEEYKITLHSEMSYLRHYPARIAFFCRQAPPVGGETIIGNMREFMKRMPAELREKLEKHTIRQVRNLAPAGISTGKAVADHPDMVSWDVSFDTDSKEQVEADCSKLGLEAIWNDDGSLTLLGYMEPFVDHPQTGERLYHTNIHTDGKILGAKYAELDKRLLSKQKMPSGFTLDNGEALTSEEAQSIADTLASIEIAWPWQEGDVMILDNLLCQHGRNPFSGSREILTALLS